MFHLKSISRRPQTAQGVTTPLESAILTILTIFFSSWTNGPTVIQNLRDFYAKTPDGA